MMDRFPMFTGHPAPAPVGEPAPKIHCVKPDVPGGDCPMMFHHCAEHGTTCLYEPDPLPEMPEIRVGDIVTDKLLGAVTVRELDGIGGVIVVWAGGMEAVVPVDDILAIYRDPLWRRTDRKEP